MRIIKIKINEKGQVFVENSTNFEGENNATRLVFDILESWKNNNLFIDAYYTNFETGLPEKNQYIPEAADNAIYFDIPQILTFSEKVSLQLMSKKTDNSFRIHSDQFNLIFKKSIMAESQTVAENPDILNNFNNRIQVMEVVVENFVANNETSIEIGEVRSGEVASVVNIGTAKNQIWNIILKKGDTGAKVVSAVFDHDDILFTFDDSTTIRLENAKITLQGGQGIQGIQGIQGMQGERGYTGNLIQVTGISLAAASWALVSGLYEISYANANITANSVVDLVIDKASISIAQAADILYYTESSAGSVKLFSKYLPSANMTVILNIYTKS
jgi:hypothetical protein